jgi:hypothetical protein
LLIVPTGIEAGCSPHSANRARPKNSQVFVVCGLPTGRFSAPFFFCLGFLASRLDRFCSLFATALSLHISAGEYADKALRFNH